MEPALRQLDPIIWPLIRLVPTIKIDDLVMDTLDDYFPGVVVVMESTILYFNQVRVPDGYQLAQSPVVISVIQSTIYLHKSSCLLEAINGELWKYLHSGLIYSWSAKFMKNIMKDLASQDDFKVLGIWDLMCAFQLQITFHLACILVFLWEFWYSKRQKRRESRLGKSELERDSDLVGLSLGQR